MLFYVVSNSWLTAQDSNVSIDRYFNKATQQINYVFSVSKKCRVMVQVKHADNFGGLEKSYDKQHELYDKGKAERSFYVVMNFDSKDSRQLESIKVKDEPGCKLVEIRACAEDWHSPYELEGVLAGFEGMETKDSRYVEEKRKGGASSYQSYKPLKDKVEELCKAALAKKNYPSANQLCNKIAKIIENERPDLLSEFEPYKDHAFNGNDWKKPTFYGWCNDCYKAHQVNTCPA